MQNTALMHIGLEMRKIKTKVLHRTLADDAIDGISTQVRWADTHGLSVAKKNNLSAFSVVIERNETTN